MLGPIQVTKNTKRSTQRTRSLILLCQVINSQGVFALPVTGIKKSLPHFYPLRELLTPGNQNPPSPECPTSRLSHLYILYTSHQTTIRTVRDVCYFCNDVTVKKMIGDIGGAMVSIVVLPLIVIAAAVRSFVGIIDEIVHYFHERI